MRVDTTPAAILGHLSRTRWIRLLAIALVSVARTPGQASQSEAAAGILVSNRAPLQAGAFTPLPLGAVAPTGWLRRQLVIQAAGLTGHLDEFWPDVGSNSGWLGGTGESWERGPYFLDGLLPLAYLLDDAQLKTKAQRWVDWTLTHQQADGQIGPPRNDDWWPRMVMLKVLTQYAEASGDPRVAPLMTRYFQYELHNLPQRPLRDWGKYRWQDNAYAVLWLYNRTGDRWLLNLVRLLHQQGYDWESQFADFQFTGKQDAETLGLKPNTKPPDRAMQTHGVNNAMALKAAPVWFLLTGTAADRGALDRQLQVLDRYHGLPNGMFSADEHFAGLDPSQGIELCAVVESMFSLEQAFAILGEPALADRLERISYNALPGTMSNDMWSHQYDQQPNQISCTRAHRQWSTNGDDSNLFGLEPNFGCCTANLHQGWPKFVSSLWMASHDGGLAAVAYAPSRVETRLHGNRVSIEEQTDYPFRAQLRFVVHVSKPLRFPLYLRVPGWADSLTWSVNGASQPQPNGGGQMAVLQRTWKEGDTVQVTLPMTARLTHWYHDAVAFERGPLVFSLPLGGEWTAVRHYAARSSDWQITPQKPWNFALQIGSCAAAVRELPLGETPFDADKPALTLAVQGKQIDDWKEVEHSAGPPPASPVRANGPLQTLTLVPYGAAKLRITAFPYLDQRASCGVNRAALGGR